MVKKSQTDVLILGAGATGLIIGFLLKKKGLHVKILEKKNRTGGSILTVTQNGFTIDAGPNSTLETSPKIQELIEMLNLQDDKIYANPVSKNRYILKYGKLIALPMSPGAFLKTRLFSFSAKLRLFAEPFIQPADSSADESLAEFVVRRLGRQFLDYAIDPFVSGVYAGVPEKLSVKAAFPKLWALEQTYGSLIKGTIKGKKEREKRNEVSKSEAKMFSFRNGMQTLTDALTENLKEDIILGVETTSITETDGKITATTVLDGHKFEIKAKKIVLSIPAYEAARLISSLDASLADSLREIEYPPVAMVFMGYKNKSDIAHDLNGFGFLVPKKENRSILGTIFSSSIFVNRAPDQGAALTTFVGGMRQPETVKLENEYLQEMVLNDLNQILGLHKDPDVFYIKKWNKAIPQYKRGHLQIIEKIESFEKQHPSFVFAANYRGGIALGDCIKNAFEHAEKIQNNMFE
jgi:oxygen-dependent protoporphyrinogen oxidase